MRSTTCPLILSCAAMLSACLPLPEGWADGWARGDDPEPEFDLVDGIAFTNPLTDSLAFSLTSWTDPGCQPDVYYDRMHGEFGFAEFVTDNPDGDPYGLVEYVYEDGSGWALGGSYASYQGDEPPELRRGNLVAGAVSLNRASPDGYLHSRAVFEVPYCGVRKGWDSHTSVFDLMAD